MAVTTPNTPNAPLTPPGAWDQLKILFGLKWRLTLRGYRRSRSAVIGALLFVLLFGPLALGGATGLGFLFVHVRAPYNEHVLRAVLLGIYLFWVLAPLLGYALNDSYDITRLFVYPVSVRRIFSGAIFGALLDMPTLLLLPTLLAAVIGFSHGIASAVLALIGVLLFLFHTLALSQAILLASAGVLRSRRFRDIVLVVLPLFWMAYYVASQTLTRQMVSINWKAFVAGPAWNALSFLPPGLAARSIARAGAGDLLPALNFLALLSLATTLTVYAAGWLVKAAYEGEDITVVVKSRPAPLARPTARPATPGAAILHRGESVSAAARPFGIVLPPVVEAMADKELKYLRRDPFFKITLMNLVYMMIVAVFAFLRGSLRHGGGGFNPAGASPWGLWGASGLLLWGVTGFVFNTFGTEGGAASALFSFPSDRRQMLLGKNLTILGALLAVNVVFLSILCAIAGRPAMIAPLLCWTSLALVVLVAIGNLVSVYFPYRVALKGWRTRQQRANQGCAYTFLYLGATAVAFVMLLPVLAALLVPLQFIGAGWLALSVPLAALYAGGLYLLSLRLAAPLLVEREFTIIEKLTQTE